MARPLLVGIGEILWDMLPSGKQLGGAPANFAYQANALGGRGVVVSRVGEDESGREIVARLDSLKIDRTFVQPDPNHSTGSVDVQVDDRGVPDYIIHQNVAWDYLETSPQLRSLANKADCVCYGTLGQRNDRSRATIAGFLAATRPDCLRVFDINLRQNYFSADLIDDLLASTRILKLNDAELPLVGQLLKLGESENDVIERLFNRYRLSVIALTRGALGSSIFTPDRVAHQAPVTVKVMDTVGAGDAFTAAMALGICAGLGLEEIGLMAARAAAYVCSQPGATPAMPIDLQIIPASRPP